MGKNLKPIKSQKEANDVKEFLINETLKVQKISREQAAKRIDALLDSGELDGLDPSGVLFAMIVDKYMETPVN